MLTLIGCALVVRGLGATLRSKERPGLVRALGWLPCAVASWMAVAAAQAVLPLWVAVAVGVAGALADGVLKHERIPILADLAIVLLAGGFSWPAAASGSLVLAAVGVPAGGLVIDSAAAALAARPLRAVSIALGVPLLAGLTLAAWGVSQPTSFCRGLRSARQILRSGQVARLGLTVPRGSGRVTLPSGSVAWLDRPAGRAPQRGAIVFHGADPRGSQQPAAVVVRRALLAAGYVVLAVDHPGYGESPAPQRQAGPEAWDPTTAGEEAYAQLTSMGMTGGVIAVGHSMGATEALRLLAGGRSLRGVALFGASLHEIGEESLSAYWLDRFHSDRRLRFRLTRREVHEILRAHYDDRKIVRRLGPDHSIVEFVAFENEHPSVVSSRRPLYDLIPGSKELITLAGSGHYFNSYGALGAVLGDTWVMRELESLFRRLGRSGSAPPLSLRRTADGR